jgi:hypothetical protein
MSPQPTLLSPVRRSSVRRTPTRALDLTEFPCPPARRLRAMPQTDLPKADLLPPLVISLAPPFERAIPLRLVEIDTPPMSTRMAAAAHIGLAPRHIGLAPRHIGLAPRHIGLAPRHIRLTRRGRLTLLVAAVLCMLVGFSLGNTLSFTAGSISVPPASHSIVVQPGQTLWGIATQAAPHADPRATVQQIIVLNHLQSTGLQAGQQLSLPS